MVIILSVGIFPGRIAVFVLLFITTGAVIKHLGTTVSTKHQTSQRVWFSLFVRTSLSLTNFLYHIPCFFIHNGFLCIFKNNPVIRIKLSGMRIFIGILVCSEINGMSHILRLFNHICDS